MSWDQVRLGRGRFRDFVREGTKACVPSSRGNPAETGLAACVGCPPVPTCGEGQEEVAPSLGPAEGGRPMVPRDSDLAQATVGACGSGSSSLLVLGHRPRGGLLMAFPVFTRALQKPKDGAKLVAEKSSKERRKNLSNAKCPTRK